MKFKLFEGAIYLSETQIDDPSQARVGFLFQNPSRTDSEFDLTQETWTNPQNKGFFAFFAPSATRNWTSFAAQVRTLFTQTQASQFGWFAESETGAVSAVTLVLVGGQGTKEPFVQSAFSLAFNNSVLQVKGNPVPSLRNTIAFDDASNAFQIANPNASPIQLTTQAPNQSRQTYASTSAHLILPMDDGADPNAGSVNVDFSLRIQDLAAFEAGFMYFGPGEAQVLTALSYPVFRPAEASQTTMAFSAWLDVLQPLVDTRSYFQFKDAVVGSYFTTPNGKTFALHPTNGNPATTSRFAFANRPINSPTDVGTYYLTPVGTFGIALDATGSSGAGAVAERADLLCGVTGTEFLTATLPTDLAADPVDQLQFESGQPAFQKVTVSTETGVPPTFLSDEEGNVTTSWVRLQSNTGTYVSQPQQSPLYNQNGEGAALLDGEAPASGLSLYLLDFLPLPTWQVNGASETNDSSAEATSDASPLVPMVPYAGLLFNTADQAVAYLQIESDALNPTRKNAFTSAQATLTVQARARGESLEAVSADQLTYAMTPQGLLAGLTPQQVWQDTQFAISPALSQSGPDVILQFTEMGDQVRQALQQNQIFLTISTLTDPQNNPLFQFAGGDQTINIAGWPFSLSPEGLATSDGTPPIVMVKLYPGRSIADLVDDISLWSQPDVFNGSTFTAKDAQAYLQKLIQDACEAVYGVGNCPEGTPSGQPDTHSLYYNFYQVVTDPQFNGLLAVNCNMQLNALPTAIRAVIGGMTDIKAFRVHHVGVSINDTSDGATPALSQSSLFGLVDYEKPAASSETAVAEVGDNYNFEVEYLRALFTNSALSSFSCKINLTINNLFGTDVTQQKENGVSAADSNVVVITGLYQAHSTSGDEKTSGQGVYSFIAEGNFKFKFGENPYLDNITLTKLQFSFDQETPDASSSDTSLIEASFGIWGSLVFKEFNVLDIFSFEKLVFNDLGISVSFYLTVPQPPKRPSTTKPNLKFSPGNLRLDLGNTTEKQGSNSLLSLLPFKLKSFLYNQHPDQQTVEDLKYFALSDIPLDPGFKLVNKFNYALLFDLDLGTLGALVGSLEAFKFSFLIGWLTDDETGGIAFGVQLPEADGKLEIKIEGVLELVIQTFILKYVTPESGGDAMLVVGMNNSYLKLLGQRLPPGNAFFDFALFAPTSDASRIGWIAAINNKSKEATLEAHSDAAGTAYAVEVGDANGENGDSKVFELIYLGGGQRVGPKPDDTPTNFADFLKWMTDTFWEEFKKGEYDKVYDPDGQWLAVADFKLLGIIEVGFIFYDVTPFYSLVLNVDKLFNFEITYTKISDSIGLFYANFSLPDSLRTFQVGAASLTLPSIGVSVYTNGNWKLDVGFPQNDDWSRSFRVQAQAGPVPVTGSGGFYIASLSSATAPDIFTGEYPSILAFGFAARLGVGKDFTSGPLKAGVSVTFFGIIEGAAGYLASGSTEIFQQPDALSLKGQFGIIGELYGSVDFVIIKASVNVRLQASVGIVLKMEQGIGGDILLYIEASVSVSVKVKINLGLFSVSISFSFKASFRFEWKLLAPSSQSSRLTLRSAFAAMPAITPTVLPLCDGFTADLPLWFLPEGTVVFPAATGTGVPWVVTSIGMEYDPEPSGTPTYAAFKPFEKLTAQLVTWALANVLGEMSDTFTVTQDQLNVLDQTPETLVDWIDYAALLAELAVFKADVTVPIADPGDTIYGTPFPMPPFMQLKTEGRLDSDRNPDDLDFVFSSKNNVSESYIEEVDAYFNQLFVNQTQSVAPQTLDASVTVPLIQSIFLNYFKGLIRGGVHQLLETMQNDDLQSAKINELIPKAVGAGQFASLSGQMSSSFRGGVRLPYADGLTVPGGSALTTTNPMYALLWQEFPAGTLDAEEKQYTISLTNPDSSQTWLTASVSWALTSLWLEPFQKVQASEIQAPSQPQQLPFTDIGPAAFAYENAIVWTQPDSATASLRPFPSSLLRLMQQVAGNISVLIKSREAGAPYLPGGVPLDPSTFIWATQIQLTLQQVPATETNGAEMLPDIFSMSGASQQDQALLEQIIRVINENPQQNPIASIQVLYQTSAGASGLTSKMVNPSDVFALRTNTTTVTAPRITVSLLALEAAEPPEVPVGATIDETVDFLQIIQQAAVTNAPGYYLRYLDIDNKSLPTDLFQGNPAPVTLLITYTADGNGNTPTDPTQIKPFYNAIVLNDAVESLVYYAETTDPTLYTQYSAVAPGSVGVLLTRSDAASLIQPKQELVAAGLLDSGRLYDHADLLKALVDAGMDDELEVQAALAASGAAVSQLNELYSLITYQVEATTGFVQSNLSAPVQPQQPDAESSAADGLMATDDETRSYRIYAPLYNLAESNQGQPSEAILNRYASINDPVAIDIFQNDAFGNQMPASDALKFTTTNLYFDPILPLDQWQGVVTAYDFRGTDGTPQADSFTIYLVPTASAFTDMSADQAEAALQNWTTIQDQINGEGVSFFVETNLALDADGNLVQVTLDQTQGGAVKKMVDGLVAYLQNFTTPPPTFDVDPVAITVNVSGATVVPPVFEVAVLFGIQRDPALISPLLKDGSGNITFPSAQVVQTQIVPTVGSSVEEGGASVSIDTFAAAFVKAFPDLLLAVGLNGAQEPQKTTAHRASQLLRANGVASDGTGSGRPSAQSIWAVQQVLVDIKVGAGDQSGPFYLSPKPLDNTLNTAVVPLPTLPEGLEPALPSEQLFTDIDLDVLNREFFRAVDNFLSPASASKTFEVARDAYSATVYGRKSIADQYSDQEVDWLFGSDSPFTGTAEQLSEAQETFAQQMRAALSTAYAVDTVVQYGVSWQAALPSEVGDDKYALFGQVQPAGGLELPKGYSFSTAKVPVMAQGASLFTFLFGLPNVKDTSSVTLDLEYNVTHLEYFLEPANQVPEGEARPSFWLQLINPYPDSPPHVGPSDEATTIPLVLRQYPTPPTVISQQGIQGAESETTLEASSNPLTAAAAWHLLYRYQAQLTVHDQLISAVTYNTDLSASSGGGSAAQAALLEGEPEFTLFEALARFFATYPVLLPVLNNLADPNWDKAATVFASLVTGVQNNTTWNPLDAALASRALARITDQYTITDREQGTHRLITLLWASQESSFPAAKLAIQAIGPDGQPYKNQVPGTVTNGITDQYTPNPPLVDDWVTHEVEVQNLNVLMAENAVSGVQVERNLIEMEGPGGTTWTVQQEFVYKTPLVRATEPVTPFVDNATLINIVDLPNQGVGQGCPQAPPAGVASLCQRIYTMMYDLLADEDMITSLTQVRLSAGQDESVPRRVKVACSFQYPVSVAGGVTSSNPVAPLFPVVLARSFQMDAAQSDQLSEFSSMYATAVAQWAEDNEVPLGTDAQQGAQFVFDITLYAQLSGLNTPVLRLRNLQLKLTDITTS